MKTIEWGFLIVNYLFLGGLSAGLFFVSALATFLYKIEEPSPYTRIARLGALLAPWPVMIGCLLLIFDLGRWYRFYKLFLHLRLVSPMSIGSWLLVLFTLVSLVNCYAWLTELQRNALFAKLPRTLAFLSKFNYDIDHWRRQLALAGLPISVGVGIYTGVLLGAVQSRPFWNTNLVAQLFLFSALSTGCAALILGLAGREERGQELKLLYGLDICFMVLEFFIVLPYLIHGQLSVQAVQDSLKLILGGPFTLLFWVFFLGMGLLTPLVIELSELVPVMVSNREFHCNRFVTAGAAVLILGGGFLLRYIFVFAGQISAMQ
jgi:formate-dependent nitrite reductase membrane component NrfD